MVERIDESRWVAARPETPELAALRERLQRRAPARYRESTLERELDALLHLAGQASFGATTLRRYRVAVLDAEGLARRLEEHRAHFIARWKAEGADQPQSAPSSRECTEWSEDTTGPSAHASSADST
jgi:hypothetical protein